MCFYSWRPLVLYLKKRSFQAGWAHNFVGPPLTGKRICGLDLFIPAIEQQIVDRVGSFVPFVVSFGAVGLHAIETEGFVHEFQVRIVPVIQAYGVSFDDETFIAGRVIDSGHVFLVVA